MTLLLHVLRRVAEGLCCSSVAWLKNKEQHIDDKMTDMDTDRILCNRPQNRYVECSGLTVVLHKPEGFFSLLRLFSTLVFMLNFISSYLLGKISTPGDHFASYTAFIILKF